MLLPVADSGVQWPQHIRVGSEEHQTNWQDPLLSLPQCLCLGHLCEFMPACCLYWLVPRSSRIWTISRTQYQSMFWDSISIHVLGPNINPCSGTQYQSMFRDSISIHVLELNINPRSGTQNQSVLWDSVSSVYALGLGITPFLGQMLGSSPVKLMLSPRAWTDSAIAIVAKRKFLICRL